MRSTWLVFGVAIMASMSFVACAQSVNDATIDPGDDGDDQAVDADVPDTGHHDYNSHDAGASGDTGGGNAGDSAAPQGDSGGSKDAGSTKDTGTVVPDSGNNNPDTGPVGGGSVCPSDSKYLGESLLEVLDPAAVSCTDGSECAAAECCLVYCVAL